MLGPCMLQASDTVGNYDVSHLPGWWSWCPSHTKVFAFGMDLDTSGHIPHVFGTDFLEFWVTPLHTSEVGVGRSATNVSTLDHI